MFIQLILAVATVRFKFYGTSTPHTQRTISFRSTFKFFKEGLSLLMVSVCHWHSIKIDRPKMWCIDSPGEVRLHLESNFSKSDLFLFIVLNDFWPPSRIISATNHFHITFFKSFYRT